MSLIAGQPLIEYTFKEAVKSPLIDRYILSTDDDKIADYAKKRNIDVPFIRPAYLATDTASSADALKHAVEFCEAEQNMKYDLVVELMCTNPFKKRIDIDNCIRLFNQNEVDSVIGVSKLEDHHPARIKKIVNGYITDFAVPETSSRRQDLKPSAYIRSGSIYSMRRDMLEKKIRYGTKRSIAYIIPNSRVVNIDTKMDFEFAKFFAAKDELGGLGEKEIYDTIRFWTMSVRDYLEEYFESDIVKVHLAGSAIIGTALGPCSPGSAYVLLHHYMGEIDGAFRAWGFSKGGTGQISLSIASAAQEYGAEIRTNASVDHVIIKNGQASGVVLSDGTELHAKTVVSDDPDSPRCLQLETAMGAAIFGCGS